MQCLAHQDASQANYVCANNQYVNDFMTVLNFGRPAHFSGGYGIVSSYIGNHVDSDVQGYAQVYATEWYNATTSCPHLKLVIGTGNDYECDLPGTQTLDSNCSVYYAGSNWDLLAHNVASYLSSKGYAWQITAWPGDDIEGSWDQYLTGSCSGPQTYDFVHGLASYEGSAYTSHLNMVDFGDADWGDSTIQSRNNQPACGSWTSRTQQNIYDAAWGVGWDVPLPETYTSGQTGRWSTVYTNSSQVKASSGTMLFYGNMTECSEGDQLSTGTYCYVGGNYDCEYTPEQGYLTLGSDINSSWYSSSYSTNIRYQGSSTTSNGNC